MSGARRTPAIMVLGTNSDAGKSLIVAGLCRLFAKRGLAVRPFKPQNMSNNAAATADGGEIGRAQALQALAARVEPSVHMNPVLLKPEADHCSQIIVQGRRYGAMRAREFGSRKAELLPKVLESFGIVSREADLVLVEGAGSPAEVNLRAGDIANLGFAEAAGVPGVLVGDIERGGVIANLAGTHALLGEAERALIRAFLINKFRGDAALFDGGLRTIAERTGWDRIGVVPWFPEASNLPAEDALGLRQPGAAADGERIVIAVPVFSRIANFDDFDPLRLEPCVDLRLVEPGQPLPREAHLIVLPGSKATIADVETLRSEGWDIDIRAHLRHGGEVIGLCGGYQMLGRRIADPDGIEGPAGEAAGLGLLDIETVLGEEKTVRPARGHEIASGLPVSGYEIHLGRTSGPDAERPWLLIDGRPEGAIGVGGLVRGAYLHGLFQSDAFRSRLLARLGGGEASALRYTEIVERTLDRLAAHLEAHLDVEMLLTIARAR
jgi:adenosylcobyric acid synthase